MKKIFLVIAITLFSMNAFAQIDQAAPMHPACFKITIPYYWGGCGNTGGWYIQFKLAGFPQTFEYSGAWNSPGSFTVCTPYASELITWLRVCVIADGGKWCTAPWNCKDYNNYVYDHVLPPNECVCSNGCQYYASGMVACKAIVHEAVEAAR